ncbi:MAG: IS5 family transposase [Candidatus Aenigmarchaeota archaeon]|nr:IS5 family transposase [Candidatus Aenigmarchaeota archaeon]
MSSRNWKEYNEQLVRRGEALLDFDFLKGWGVELKEMNAGKRGKPYDYPLSYIRFLAFIYVAFNLPYRQLEGFIRAMIRLNPRLEKPDHATIHRRVMKLNLNLSDSLKKPGKPITIAVDASGIKVTNRGDWIRKKWKKEKRGFLKIHFAVDTKKRRIISMEVTDERTGDIKKFKSLVKGSGRVKKVLADAAYDSRDNFSFLKENGIEAGIKPRKVEVVPKGWIDLKGRRPSVKARGNIARKKEVVAYSMNQEQWKKKKGYGQRWSVESVFSAFKRIFGEHARAKEFDNMVREMRIKAFVYNFLASC